MFVSFYLIVVGFTSFPLPLLAVTKREFLTTPCKLSQYGFPGPARLAGVVLLFLFLGSFCLGSTFAYLVISFFFRLFFSFLS